MKVKIRNRFSADEQNMAGRVVHIKDGLRVMWIKEEKGITTITLHEDDKFICNCEVGTVDVGMAPMEPCFDWVDVTMECEMRFLENNGEYLLELWHDTQMVGMIGSNQWESASGENNNEDEITNSNFYRIVNKGKTMRGTNWFRVEHWEEMRGV